MGFFDTTDWAEVDAELARLDAVTSRASSPGTSVEQQITAPQQARAASLTQLQPQATQGSSSSTQRTMSLFAPAPGRQGQPVDAVGTPPPPDAFRGLQVDQRTQLSYEYSSVPAISGADPMLRRLSPFMLQVELPLAYANSGFGGGKAKPGINIDVYGNASSRAAGYASARTAVANSGLAAVNTNVESLNEFISVNSRKGPAVHQDAQGLRTEGTGEDKPTRLGTPVMADIYQAVDIARQLATILNVPPLVLLVNPQTLSIQYTKVQSFQDRTRYGYIFHAWGEEQAKLSITAKCGAFISGGRGVQYASKRDSAAWQNLMTAFQFYKSNGYIYDTVGKSHAHHFVGALSIHYDGWIYYGHMESLSYAYDEGIQGGGIQFTLEFVASTMLDTNQPVFSLAPLKSPTYSPSDPRYMQMTPRPGAYTLPAISADWQGIPTSTADATTKSLGMGVLGIPVPTSAQPVTYNARPTKGGFTPPATTESRTVNAAAPDRVQPFRVR